MPSLTQDDPVMPSSKKRRREEKENDNNNIHVQLYAKNAALPLECWADPAASSPQHIHASQNIFAAIRHNDRSALHSSHTDTSASSAAFVVHRKIHPLAKRIRLENEARCVSEDESARRSQESEQTQPASPQPRQPKSATPNAALQQTDANTRPELPRTMSAAVLRPCHICHRRPTKKSDLDSFADCQGCGERTCFICIRQCLGWRTGNEDERIGDMPFELPAGRSHSASFTMEDAGSENNGAEPSPQKVKNDTPATSGGGHRQMVCSLCCVERGQDGDVVCLGCLPFVDG